MAQDDRDRNLIVTVLAGVGLGAIIGAIAGILFAPRPGVETREKLGETLQGLGSRIGDLSDEVGTRVRSAVKASRSAMAGDTSGAEEGGDRMGG
jgi:gas vesicle protein